MEWEGQNNGGAPPPKSESGQSSGWDADMNDARSEKTGERSAKRSKPERKGKWTVSLKRLFTCTLGRCPPVFDVSEAHIIPNSFQGRRGGVRELHHPLLPARASRTPGRNYLARSHCALPEVLFIFRLPFSLLYLFLILFLSLHHNFPP